MSTGMTTELATMLRTIGAEATAEDGVEPFDEQTLLDVSGAAPKGQAWTIGEPVAGIAYRGRSGNVELAVRPDARGMGLGRQLVAAVRGDAEAAFWAHGDLPAARALAKAAGLVSERVLLLLGRTLEAGEGLPEGRIPEGITVRNFDRAVDMPGLVVLNARAFKDLPDQGLLTEDDFAARMDQPWFDASLLFIAERSGEPVGMLWLKPEQDSLEVYAVGVVSAERGVGLGSYLVALALHTASERGYRRVSLYVDASNSAAVHVYGKMGFGEVERHVLYGVVEGASLPRDFTQNDILRQARLGSAVSSKSLRELAREARHEVDKEGSSRLPKGRFADRELSWLAFNERVLEQAEDQDLQLLERAWFLSIFTSNLDEFFMVRVAGLKRRIDAGMAVTAASGLRPTQVMDGISKRTHELAERQARVFRDDVVPKLAKEGIILRHWNELKKKERTRLSRYFKSSVFPVLTPLSVDPSHPFPYISGLSLNIAVTLRRGGNPVFARVKVPGVLPRWVSIARAGRDADDPDIGDNPNEFIALEELIGEHLDQLFPGMKIESHSCFRVTRNEDVEVEEDDAENLLTALEKELRRRRFGPVVRLEVEEDMPDRTLRYLKKELGLRSSDVYRLPAPLDLGSLDELHDVDRPDLKYPKYVPVTPPGLTDGESAKPADMFEKIREHEVLVHHPYESFSTSVQQLLAQAAMDPKVLAIKQTLYRTSGDSPIVDSLIRAAQAGKQVLAVVEIKARFDEQRNIEWARKLERAGVHVVYGMIGLKTHCKLAMVVRQEDEGLVRYCHVGTGNYNPKTARGYEDLGLFTCDHDVGQDLTRLFNHLSGFGASQSYHRLLVAPEGIRAGIMKRIEREVRNKQAGKPAWIKFKANAVLDEPVIDALYRASQAGVPISIQVRGICALRAGIPGLSGNIRVRSILGRFLEHSRIYAFCNDGDTDVYIGSADLMHRNLSRRIEALIKIVEPDQIAQLVELIDVACANTTSSWRMGTDGWTRVTKSPKGKKLVDIQELLMKQARSSVASR